MESKIIQEKTFSNRKQITTQYFKEDETITLNEIAEIIQNIEEEALNSERKNFQLMVRGLAPDKWTTIKNFSQEFEWLDNEEYLENKVADTSKFEEFYQLHITTIEEV